MTFVDWFLFLLKINSSLSKGIKFFLSTKNALDYQDILNLIDKTYLRIQINLVNKEFLRKHVILGTYIDEFV